MILVGTSGYDHPDWVGPYYPEGTTADDLLKLYAADFDMVELASTYERQPAAEEMARLRDVVGDGFVFSALVHQSVPAGELGQAERFREGLRPLWEAGQLACVLAPFPTTFENNRENRDRLLRLRDALAGLPLVVEFTAGGWIAEGMSSWLAENGLGFCCVDLPRRPGLAQPVSWVTGEIGYVRFHGRNRAAWEPAATEVERHDYRYDPLELAEWLPRVEEMDVLAPLIVLCLCNTPRAQAVESARFLRRMLGVE